LRNLAATTALWNILRSTGCFRRTFAVKAGSSCLQLGIAVAYRTSLTTIVLGAVQNMASMEKEVSFERKFTQMCVSTETNAICHDVMFCRPAAPASIESNELEHPQRVQSKSAETAGRPLPRQGRRSSKIKEEPCRKLGHATLRLPTFRYTI